MPNLRSAKKRLRQDVKKQLRNQAAKTRIKTETKKVLQGGDVRPALSVLDRAAAKGIIHPNAAARRKSRLARLANSNAATTTASA